MMKIIFLILLLVSGPSILADQLKLKDQILKEELKILFSS